MDILLINLANFTMKIADQMESSTVVMGTLIRMENCKLQTILPTLRVIG